MLKEHFFVEKKAYDKKKCIFAANKLTTRLIYNAMNKLKLSILKVRKIKKTAILIMSLLLAVGAAAQSHSFGDTS